MPGRIRFADLPAPVRKRLSRVGQGTRKEDSASPSTAGRQSGKCGGWRCTRCGQTFCWYAAAEAHADQTRHLRLAAVV
jgi:hypothetical protein